MQRANGRAIEDYKDLSILETGLAMPNAEPALRESVDNGLLPYDFIVDGNLELYLPLYLLKGAKFKSVDRNKHTATVTGALWKPDSRLFDGSDDKIALPAAAFDALTSCTIAMWYKPDINLDAQANHRYLFSFYKDGNNFIIIYYSHTTNIIRLLEYVGGATKAAINATGGAGESQAWHYIAAVFGVGGAQMWIDGTSQGTDTETECVADIAATTENNIGFYTTGSLGWSGYIGEVWVYSRKLSATELEDNRAVTKWRYT